MMKDFHHDAYQTRDLIWSLQSTPRLVDFTFAVRDDECRELATEVIDTFTQTVVPCYPNMQRGLLHGDFNEQNIIVRPKPGTVDHAQPEYQVAGFIDFGDSHRSYYVFELAVLIAHVMLKNGGIGLIEVGGHVIAGYFSVKPLSDLEFDLLKVCVASRYTQALVMSEYTYTQVDPGNQYLLTTGKTGWPQLKRLWSTPKEEIKATWKAIMNTYT
ncbi:PREDICTED: hydroxylysine kinase-like [Priapulus caudatus]|uniref:Hydroxylysine kinase n=1 Tax=Priapulus caudatus TaxID=37621 RepID=A0ABM1F369_PRICU|nr:PREDICTED: hydroxylysine kinase-like [Priapulus caudatus]